MRLSIMWQLSAELVLSCVAVAIAWLAGEPGIGTWRYREQPLQMSAPETSMVKDKAGSGKEAPEPGSRAESHLQTTKASQLSGWCRFSFVKGW